MNRIDPKRTGFGAVTKAYDNLDNAIAALPGDNTLAQDLVALQPQLDAFPQAYRETFDLSGFSSVY